MPSPSKRYDNLLKSDAVSIDAAEAKRQGAWLAVA